MRAIRLPIFLVVLALSFFAMHFARAADTTCPNSGERPATAADVEYMKNNGFPTDYQQVGRCWNPDDKNVGVDVAKAKENLSAVRCGTSVNVAQLDPKFSGCVDKFMQALRKLSPTACITSAYRSEQLQATTCKSICGQLSCPGLCAAPGKSYHQKGLAIDLSKITISKQQLWQLALQSGVGNPTGLHNSDPYHIQSMNGGMSCATAGYLPTNDDTFTAGPLSSNPYFGYSQNPLPTMQPLTAAPSLSMTPTQTATPSTGSTNTGTQSQPQICNPSYSCSAGTMYYQTTSCTTQVYQLCVYGCDGNACKTASTTSSTLNTVTGAFSSSSTSTSDTEGDGNTNSNTNTNDNTSISDILNSLSIGDLFTSTDVGTSVPLSLNSSINQIGSLQSGSSTYPAGTAVATGTIQSYQPIGGQSTFTSQDLVYLPQAVITRTSATFSILEGMKNALLGALNFLLSLGR